MNDDVIRINTTDSSIVTESIPKFDLVRGDSPIMNQVLPEFDFSNPPVDPIAFASSLVETCKAFNGIGLSANQCGFNHRVFVMGANDDYVAFFNPKVIKEHGEVHMEEACLSFPLLGLHITRAESVDVEYQDYNGVTRQMSLIGIGARCFLHELDHMNGIVYTSRAKPLALQQGLKRRVKLIKTMRRG